MYTIAPWLVIVILISVLAFIVITVVWGIRAHRLKVSAGREELLGRTAIVETALEPKGTVFIEGELWTAILEGGQAKSGEEVTITKADGLKLWVAKKQ